MIELGQNAQLSLFSLLLAIRREGNHIKSLAIRLAKAVLQGEISGEKFMKHFPHVSKANWDLARKELDIALAKGVTVISIFDSLYPPRLRTIVDPPLLLFVRGNVELSGFNSDSRTRAVVAIVGMRDANQVGMQHALSLAEQLSKLGCIVVSGLAMGIDAAAHRGVILAAEQCPEFGAGIAVLGSGVCNVSPSVNDSLAELLVASGGVLISEYAVYAEARKYTFPERNRIISGLSDVVVVVQADYRSGARITASCALEQGRDVLAMPGSVGDRRYAGTNRLIKEGAHVLTGVEDVLELLPQLRKTLSKTSPEKVKVSSRQESYVTDDRQQLLCSLDQRQQDTARLILQALDQAAHCNLDSLVEVTAMEVNNLLSVLGVLEVLGAVSSLPGNVYSLTHRL